MSDQAISIAVGGDIFANGRSTRTTGRSARRSRTSWRSPTPPTSSSRTTRCPCRRGASRSRSSRTSAPTRRSRPDIGRLGLDVVSIANNHMMDYGAEAMADTIACLDEQRHRARRRRRDDCAGVEPVVVDVRGPQGRLPRVHAAWSRPVRARRRRRPGVAPIHVQSAYEINPYWQAEEPGEPAMVTIKTFADAAEQAFAEERVRDAAQRGRLPLPLAALGLRRSIEPDRRVPATARARDDRRGRRHHPRQPRARSAGGRAVQGQGDRLQPGDVHRPTAATGVRGRRDHRPRALAPRRHVAGRLRHAPRTRRDRAPTTCGSSRRRSTARAAGRSPTDESSIGSPSG